MDPVHLVIAYAVGSTQAQPPGHNDAIAVGVKLEHRGFHDVVARPDVFEIAPIFGRAREHPAIGDRRRTVHRGADIGAPDYLAVGRIERQHLGIAGRDVKPVVPERRPAAERAAAQFLGLQIDAPYPLAARGVEGADLDSAVHRVDPPLHDQRLRQHPGIAGRAVADPARPGARELLGQCRMAHRMSRIAAGLGPIRIDRRRRQGDRGRGER